MPQRLDKQKPGGHYYWRQSKRGILKFIETTGILVSHRKPKVQRKMGRRSSWPQKHKKD